MTELAPSDFVVPEYLEIRRTGDGDGLAMLTLHGELDLGSAPSLEQALSDFQGPAGCQRLVIDLGNLRFMDSTGLALMVRAEQTAQDHGYQLVFRPGSHQVQRLLELTGVIDRLEFEQP